MIKFAALTILMFSTVALSSERNQIINAVYKLQPSITKVDAIKIAKALQDVSRSKTCDIAWPILLAIAFNESSLIKSSVNSSSKDYGLMQINHKNIIALHLDKVKLMHNEKYSLNVACTILTKHKRMLSLKYPYWLGSYRSGTALWKKSVIISAKKYDKVIKKLVAKIGYKVSSPDEYNVAFNY